MSIDHLVISGGGHNILPMFGAVKFLVEKEYINFSNITTFDGTSAGALLGFTLLTGIDLEEIEIYLVKRPWEKIFSITPEQIFGAFKSKGLFDVTLIQQILTPLMNAADISIDITFLEFYEKNSIEFTVYATELNSLETEYFSYKTTPNMRILDGLYISSAVPPLFKPCIKDNKCYLDGGVFSNYPIDEFLKRHPDAKKSMQKAPALNKVQFLKKLKKKKKKKKLSFFKGFLDFVRNHTLFRGGVSCIAFSVSVRLF